MFGRIAYKCPHELMRPLQAGEQRIGLQPRAPRACRKRRLKKGERFFAWPRGTEPDCNSLCYYTRSLNSKPPNHAPIFKTTASPVTPKTPMIHTVITLRNCS